MSTRQKVVWLKGKDLIRKTKRKFKRARTVLDIGPGIRPQDYIVPEVHICCEPYKEYVEKLKKKANNEFDRNYIIINAAWDKALEIIPEKSVDTIFLLDIVEHLDKKTGKKLLKKTEALAKKQIVLFTPLGFMPQVHPDGKDAWGLGGGDWQEHKSGWKPEDFDNTWDIYASKEFHFLDHNGVKFDKPYGAFWAIKNFKNKSKRRFCVRILLHLIIDGFFDFFRNIFMFCINIIKAVIRKIFRK